MPTNLTKEAIAGQTADRIARRTGAPATVNPHLFSSPVWLGYEAGREFGETSIITKASTSRGYSVKIELYSGHGYLVMFRGTQLDTKLIKELYTPRPAQPF